MKNNNPQPTKLKKKFEQLYILFCISWNLTLLSLTHKHEEILNLSLQLNETKLAIFDAQCFKISKSSQTAVVNTDANAI